MTELNRVWMVRERLRISSRHRSPDEYMDRFGGGWRWCLGFDASARFRTVIVNLLTFSVRLTIGRRNEQRYVYQCQSNADVALTMRCDLQGGHPGCHQHDTGTHILYWQQGKGYVRVVAERPSEKDRLVRR